MISVGELQVELDAKTREFQQAIGRAQDRLDKLERKARTSTQNIGTRLRGMANAAGATAIAFGTLATAAAAFGAVRLFQASTSAAATQEDAIASLDAALARLGPRAAAISLSLQGFAAELQKVTRFGDEETIAAQARLAAFVDEEESIRGLTAAAQDFATARGIQLVEAADLIAKSVGSSTNALVRYGIEITGAAGSTERAESTVRAITRVFGGQARAAALTYAGAIQQLRNAFGDVLEEIGFAVTGNETLGGVIRNTIIPALERFGGFVRENREELSTLVTETIPAIVRGLAEFARVLATGIQVLEFFVGVGKLARVVLAVLQFNIVTAFNALRTVFEILAFPIKNAQALLKAFSKAITGDFAGALRVLRTETDTRPFERIAESEKAAASVVVDATQELVNQNDVLDDLQVGLRKTATLLEKTATATEEFSEANRTAAQAPGPTGGGGTEPAGRTRAQEASLKKLQNLERQIANERLQQLDPLVAQAQQIENQIEDLRALDVAAQDRALVEARIRDLQQQQTELLVRQGRAAGDRVRLEAQVRDQLADLSRVDPAAAEDLRELLREATSTEVGEGLVEALRGISDDARDALDASLGPSVGDVFAGGLGQGFQAFLGDGNFLDAFAATIQRSTQESLSKAFQESVDELGNLLSETFDGLGGRLGEIFGNRDLLQGALGIGAAIFQGLRNQASVSTSVGGARSAVTSTQQVRGIVAGPTQIAVAQIARGIQDAFRESERLLRIIAENTGRLADGGSPQLAAVNAAGAALALESESLV